MLIAAILMTSIVLPALAAPPANQHFQRTWARTDQPVQSGQVSRTWMWGPEGFTSAVQENYQEAPGGVRTVQYFDKSRMEITNPDADPNSIWYVTNGLLVMELITGQMQLGHSYFASYDPAAVNVAGDHDDPTGPTYETFGSLLDAPSASAGTTYTMRVDRDGNVANDPALANHNVTAAHHVLVPGIDHQVASVFWAFMNSTGPVYEQSSFTTAKLFEDPFYATGYPVTEPYWANVLVGGTPQDVLMQCFERRCLTFNPGNPAGWQVEAGNVGQHYHYWRYVQVPNGEEGPNIPTSETVYGFLDQFGSAHDFANQIDTPTGLAIGSNNRLYVADYQLDRIQMYTLSGMFIGSWGMQGSNNSEFNEPRDVAVDRFGNVYVTDQGNDRVQRFSAEGAYLGQFGSAGNGDGQFILADGIAISSEDIVYVADRGAHRIQMFTLNGNYIGEWGTQGDGNGQLDHPSRIAIDSEGNIYVTEIANNRVQKFDASGTYIAQVGETGSDSGQFNIPVGIETVVIGANEYVAVVDYMNHRFQWFTTSLDLVGAQGSEGTETGQYNLPFAIAMGPGASMYIGEAGNQRVQVSIDDGDDTFFITGDSRGRFVTPVGLTIDGSGDILTADYALQMVQKFNPDGAFEQVMLATVFAHDLAAAPNGLIYAIDPFDRMVTAFDGEGSVVHTWGGNGSGNGQFSSPLNIAVDGDNNVYVTDSGLDRVQKFTATGTYITQWGSAGTGNGQFDTPMGIAVHGDLVYVADTQNHRVQVFSTAGEYLDQFGSFGSGDGQFSGPVGIAVDSAGYIYITDTGNDRVQIFTAEGDYVLQFGEAGSNDGQLNTPFGISVAANGNVYVADSGNKRVQIFAPVE